MSCFSNLVAILLLLPAVSVWAQSSLPADTAGAMYDHGVNNYFDGNFSRAEMYLHRSLELRPTDPRTHYFLGLTMLRQGRSEEAESFIQQGALVEAASGGSASVGHALQRVQGNERIEFERIRNAARSNTTSVADENSRRRQEQFDRRQQVVLRKPVHFPLEILVNPVEPDQLANLLIDGTGPISPASIAEATPEEPAVEDTEAIAAADEGDPFGDDPISTTSTEAAPSGAVQRTLVGVAGRMGSPVSETIGGFMGKLRGFAGMVPGLGGGPPSEFPGGAGPEGFGPGDFGPGEFGPMESGDEDNLFGSDASPFGSEESGEDSTPSSGEMEDNPFEF